MRPLSVLMINFPFGIVQNKMIDGWSQKEKRPGYVEEGYEWEESLVKAEGMMVVWLVAIILMIILSVFGRIMTRKLS